ncbi:restriction endonuclease subunit S [Aeromonas rivipollensis]|uniref:restriction endonuclease subunit S n=2 Tax=Aeromonas TaxID=642 RepID=UPI003D193672
MTWPMVKLKNCCTIVGGATPRRDEKSFWDSPDIPWITPKDISNLKNKVIHDAPEYISQLGFDKSATFMLPEGSVLLTSRAPIGNLAVTGKPMCTNQGFKSLVPNPDVDCTYLYYCMLANIEKLQALGNGATFKEVSKKVVEDFEIPLPPLDEQKRIAAILDKADAIRQKRQQAIALADDFLRSVFLDMFGDPITNPKKWDMQPIGKLLQIKHGFAFKSEFFTSKGEYILMTPGNFFERGGYRNRQEKQNYYNGNIPDGYILNAGNLLVAMTEQATGLLGSCLVVPDAGKFLHNQRLGLLKFNQDALTPEYLYYLFNNESVRQAIQVSATGTKVRHTSPNKIEEIMSIVPDIKTQVRFSEIVQFIAKIKNNLEPSESESKILFNSLSQKAFSGQL